MADDRHYVGGDYYQLDDNTGFKVRASTTRQQWNSVVTQPQHFNPRQVQDLVVGVRDDQSVPMPRPRQQNQYVFASATVTAPAARGSTTIAVDTTIGFTVGDRCQVMLDQGEQFPFVLSAIGELTLSWTGPGLAGSVGTLYGDPIENQVVDLTSALLPVNEKPSYSE